MKLHIGIFVLLLAIQQCSANPNMGNFTNSLRRFSAYMSFTMIKVAGNNQNLFYSPISIAETLGMLMAGSHGNTYTEIERALVNDANLALQQRNYNKLFSKIHLKVYTGNEKSKKRNEKAKVLSANRAFVQENYPILSNYTDDLETYYYAEAESMNFGNAEGAANRINKWVSEKTNGMIPDLVAPSDISGDTRLILTNALYFQANWKEEMELQGKKLFRNTNGPPKQVTFIGKRMRMKYSRNPMVQVIIPYKSSMDTYMIIAMPNNDGAKANFIGYNGQIAFFERTMLQESEHWREGNVVFSMPQFEMEETTDMKGILQEMNIKDLFDQTKANLSGITSLDDRLHVSKFKHKAKITVDQTGTEAAAASAAIILGRSAAPNAITINKPFYFAIVRHGHVLFFGCVMNL